MKVGALPARETGVFRTLMLPETAEALERGEPVTALGLTDGDVAAGVLAGYILGEHFEISSLFVSPEYRRRGGGRMLLEALEQVLTGQVKTIQLSVVLAGPEMETLPRFLEGTGFYVEPDREMEGRIYCITLGEIAHQTFFAGNKRGRGTPVCQADESALSLAEKYALAEQLPLPPGGLRGEKVDREVSVVWEQDGRVEAWVEVDKSWPGGLTVSSVCSWSKDPIAVPSLLRAAMARARALYPPQTPVVIEAGGGVAERLVQVLLPGARVVSRTYVRAL